MAFVCRLCPRMCGVCRGDQGPGQGPGACRMGEGLWVARIAPHFDEEPCISGTRGSGTVFFSGCPLLCAFCQNEPVSHGCFGKAISGKGLLEGFRRLIDQGVHNINLVSPTHYARALYPLLEKPLPVPVVWNSGGYERPQVLRAFAGRVQVYLPDLKYVDGCLSQTLSGAPDYFTWASAALKEMYRQVGPPVLDEDGLIRRGLIVRHLILPGCVEDSMRALDFIAKELPGAWVSLMAQYMPFAHTLEMPPFDRPITQAEYDRVYDHLLELGLEEGYVQELGASDQRYIPSFDLTGVEGLE